MELFITTSLFAIYNRIFIAMNSYYVFLSSQLPLIGSSILAGIFFVVMIVLLIKLLKSNKLARVTEDEKKKIEDSYEEFEKSYEDLTTQQKELMKRYDELKLNEEHYKKLAFIDALTQLPNRAAVVEQLDNIFRTLRPKEQVELMYLDIDNLKEVNDTLGVAYGDELLIDITHRIKQALDENDFFGRYSGDEFVILSQNLEDIADYDEKVKKVQKMFSYPFSLANKEWFVSVNIGICMLGKDGKNTQSILKNASETMNYARSLGKNQFCYFGDEIQNVLTEKIKREAEIRTAFENNEFYLQYQPILDLKNHKVKSFEVLLRWNHPINGVLLPQDFLEAAKETGVIVPLGMQMLRQACLTLKGWEDLGYKDISIMINFAERQLLDSDLIASIKMILSETGVKGSQIVFDVSEAAFSEKEAVLHKQLEELRQLDIQLSLDNFGITKGALMRIKDYRFQYIKLDAVLLHEIEKNTRLKDFVNNLSRLIEGLGSKVIYEGIEDSEQLDAIDSSIHYLVQGFLFGQPLDKSEISSYLDTWVE